MILSSFFKTLVPATCVSLAFACSGGGDGDSGGDGDGDVDGSGGLAGYGDGDTATGGKTATGGSPGDSDGDGDGDGPIIDGSGTVDMTFNGTQVELEAWYVSADANDGELNFVADSTDGGSVDGVQILIRSASVGTFDCTNLLIADIAIQADDSEGSTASFESSYAVSCAVTVTEYGAVGEAVRGTFQAELGEAGGETVNVQGGFDLVRGSDS